MRLLPLIELNDKLTIDESFEGDPFEIEKDEQHKVQMIRKDVWVYSPLFERYVTRLIWVCTYHGLIGEFAY